MIEILTPTLAVNKVTDNLFYYQNTTSQMQIIRVNHAVPQHFEKVVFPGERMLFHSTSEASLDIYTRTTTGFVLIEQVPCSQLQVIKPEI